MLFKVRKFRYVETLWSCLLLAWIAVYIQVLCGCFTPGADKVVRTDSVVVPKEAMRPSYTHEALQKLVSIGLIQHVISQNTDCLHRLSGVPRDRLSELHGNMFYERCEKCGARYERPYAVSRRISCISNPVPRICIHCHINHRTGRLCERKVRLANFSCLCRITL